MAADDNPEHQMTVRSATSEEVGEFVRRQRAEGRGWWGCMVAFALSAGTIGGMVSLLFGVSSLSSFVAVGAIVGFAYLSIMLSVMMRHFRRDRRRVAADAERQEVEVIQVTSSRAMDLSGDHSSVDPAVAIDIGEDKLLVLKGPWLSEHGYGARKGRFPTSSFTLSRWPHSGEVVALEVEGRHVKAGPNQSRAKLTGLPSMPSIIIEGTLSDITDAITRASER